MINLLNPFPILRILSIHIFNKGRRNKKKKIKRRMYLSKLFSDKELVDLNYISCLQQTPLAPGLPSDGTGQPGQTSGTNTQGQIPGTSTLDQTPGTSTQDQTSGTSSQGQTPGTSTQGRQTPGTGELVHDEPNTGPQNLSSVL